MPMLSGTFSIFKDIDKISAQSLTAWINKPYKNIYLENYLANRLLYPQTIPTNQDEMDIDLAILTECVHLNPVMFYNGILRQVTIPEEFVLRFKPFENLCKAFIDGLSLFQTSKMMIKKSDGQILNGWIIKPLPLKDLPNHVIDLTPNKTKSQRMSLKSGTLTYITVEDSQTVILRLDDLFQATLDFHNLGAVIDLRKPLNR